MYPHLFGQWRDKYCFHNEIHSPINSNFDGTPKFELILKQRILNPIGTVLVNNEAKPANYIEIIVSNI